MKIPRCLSLLGSVVLPCLVFLSRADGQEEKLVVHPPLSQIFPLDPRPDGMRLKFSILLNEHSILGPDVILRFIYVDPTAGARARGGGGGDHQEGGGGGHGRHHGGSSQDSDDPSAAYSRSSSSSGGSDASPPTDPENAKKTASELNTEKWTQADLFQQALDSAPDMGTMLVYSVPGKPKLQSAPLDLPDGMLLAEIDGHVRVLGLTNDSTAFQSGVQPQDEIRSFEGHLTVASLVDFQRIYRSVKEEARKSDKSYTIEVWRPGESKLITIQIAAPPSLHSLL